MRTQKNFNVIWKDQAIPKILRIYNNKVLGGKNWIGILEKNVLKHMKAQNKSYLTGI